MAAGTMRDLANWCHDFGPKLKAATNERKKMVVLAIENDLTQVTPVDTGAAISNWQVTLGDPATDVIEPYVPSQQGTYDKHDIGDGQGGAANATAAMEVAQAVVATALPGDTIYISNPVPYMQYLNEDGISKQAQPGFFERAILAARDLADRAKLTV